MRAGGRVAAALVGIAFCGCGDASDERTADADSAAVEAPTVVGEHTACDVITEAELEGVLALELEPGRLVNLVPGVVSQCRWELPGDAQRGVSISLYQQRGLDDYRAVPGGEAVTGLGDDAVWNAEYGQLAVTSGTRLLSLGLLVENPPRIVAERIAQLALPRLSGPVVADSAAPAAPVRP